MARVVGKRLAQPVGIALDHGRLGKALAQQLAEGRVELDQHEP